MNLNSMIAGILLFSTVQVAQATGGFYCKAVDEANESFLFEVNGVTTRGFMSPIIQADGVLKGTTGDDGEANLTEFNEVIAKEDIKQYWNFQNDFKLIAYKDMVFGDDGKLVKGPLTLIIETKAINEDNVEFEGSLTVDFVKSGVEQSFSMSISCSVE